MEEALEDLFPLFLSSSQFCLSTLSNSLLSWVLHTIYQHIILINVLKNYPHELRFLTEDILFPLRRFAHLPEVDFSFLQLTQLNGDVHSRFESHAISIRHSFLILQLLRMNISTASCSKLLVQVKSYQLLVSAVVYNLDFSLTLSVVFNVIHNQVCLPFQPLLLPTLLE